MATVLGLLAPRDRGERGDDAREQQREHARGGRPSAAHHARGDADEEGQIDERVARDVEHVPEPRLGAAAPRQLAVAAVEHGRDEEECDATEQSRRPGRSRRAVRR